jgi:pimeloyl-ACP methyl ester carboxylesterase
MDGPAEVALDAAAAALPVRLSRLEDILAGAGARLDRFVLDVFLRRRSFSTALDSAPMRARLGRAGQFYADPRFLSEPDAFFVPPAPIRARTVRRRPLPAGEVLDVAFTTDFVPVFPEARGELVAAPGVARWWRHATPGRPTMLCVHGFGGGHLWLEALAFDCARFYRAGVDVLLYVLPWHGVRSPGGAHRSGEGFFDVDLVRTNEAFAQGIYELRALLRWLESSGAGPVGAFGMSLGGYTTALLAAVEPRLAFAVPMIPLAALPEMMWSTGAGDPRLARAVEHGWSLEALRAFFRVHAPLARRPLVPHDRRLIIAAVGDRICPPPHAEALWRHWGQPRLHWYPGGHLAQFRRGVALREVRRLLRDAGILTRPE